MNTIKFLTLFLVGICFAACQDAPSATNETAGMTYQRVANSDFKKLMANMPNVQLVDVRTPGEYADGRIGNAQNIDYKAADFKMKIDALDKSKPVLVYCQAGGRSQKACGIMQGMGFKEIYELESGYGGWE